MSAVFRCGKGTWLLAVRVLSDELWERVKGGDLTGFLPSAAPRGVPRRHRLAAQPPDRCTAST